LKRKLEDSQSQIQKLNQEISCLKKERQDLDKFSGKEFQRIEWETEKEKFSEEVKTQLNDEMKEQIMEELMEKYTEDIDKIASEIKEQIPEEIKREKQKITEEMKREITGEMKKKDHRRNETQNRAGVTTKNR